MGPLDRRHRITIPHAGKCRPLHLEGGSQGSSRDPFPFIPSDLGVFRMLQRVSLVFFFLGSQSCKGFRSISLVFFLWALLVVQGFSLFSLGALLKGFSELWFLTDLRMQGILGHQICLC